MSGNDTAADYASAFIAGRSRRWWVQNTKACIRAAWPRRDEPEIRASLKRDILDLRYLRSFKPKAVPTPFH